MIKKILILAGSHFQVPVIEYAKRKGAFVITCDNRPENPGHCLSDKYINVSTTDLDGILKVAKDYNINGILAYGSDIAAPTAAYVSEKLNLIGNSFKTINILTDKGLFRKFLSEIEFPVPKFKVVKTRAEAINYRKDFNRVVFIKPVDSSGSKGITKSVPGRPIQNAFEHAMCYSRKKEVIIEEEIQSKGPHIHGEAFFKDGELKFLQLGDQYFSNVNECAPLSTTFPTLVHSEIMGEIENKLLYLISKVQFLTGGLNIEIIRDKNNKIYFIEIGPRNGGNLMPELAKLATGYDLAVANVNVLLGEGIDFKSNKPNGIYCTQVILHSHEDGLFVDTNIPEKFMKYLTTNLIYLSKGDFVKKYSSSQEVIGIMLFKFKNMNICNELISYIKTNQLVKITN